MLRSESFFSGGGEWSEKGGQENGFQTHEKTTIILLVTKAHPLSLISHPSLHYPTTSHAIFHITAIPPGKLKRTPFRWRFSMVANGMGKQTPEVFASRDRVS